MIQIDNYAVNPSKVLKVERFSNKTLVHMLGVDQPIQVTDWAFNPQFITTFDRTLEINPANVSLIHQAGLKKVIYMSDGSRTLLPDEVALVFPCLQMPEAPAEEPVYNSVGEVIVEEPTLTQVMTEPEAIGGCTTQSISLAGVLSPVTYVPPKAVKSKK